LYNRPMAESELTLEQLGRKNLEMYQIKDGFRFGTDTVLLAWFTASFVKGRKPVKALELGANCGAASLLLIGRKGNVSVDSLELDHDAYEVLKKNIELNSLGDIMLAHEGDVRELPDDIRRSQYDLVFMNPPFFKTGTGPSSDSNKPGKLQGRFENNGGLEDFISAGASRLIPSSGIMCIVMTARRTDEVICLMEKYQVKPVAIMPVHPAYDKNAEMVLIAGRRTDKDPQLEIMPPLVLNDKDRMNDIYNKEHEDCFI